MEKIPENHLGCDRNLVNNGKNYQPQLVISISVSGHLPQKLNHFEAVNTEWTIIYFLEKKEVRKMIREYIPNPWQKRFHVDTT